jgi:hypothetical protein
MEGIYGGRIILRFLLYMQEMILKVNGLMSMIKNIMHWKIN